MRVLIAGIDGYLGWSLAKVLLREGHEVGGIDAFLRRKWVDEVGSVSAVPIAEFKLRQISAKEVYGRSIYFREADLCGLDTVQRMMADFEPEVIVHLGECPSAPYSMIDARHAAWVQTNNIVSTLNLAYSAAALRSPPHIIKLGTMGEYGTPSLDIPEGFFEVTYRGRTDRLPFPRQALSWYHWSKVHGSNNLMFAATLLGLRITDVMQGVVFGTRSSDDDEPPELATRFDIDDCFGTAVNRFCAAAVIGHRLPLYGGGEQRRGVLPLRDCMQCLQLIIRNPPEQGEYRVVNQFESVYSIIELAEAVRRTCEDLDLYVRYDGVDNPRIESQNHYYNPDREILAKLGYQPTTDIDTELRATMSDLIPHARRIAQYPGVIDPRTRWSHLASR